MTESVLRRDPASDQYDVIVVGGGIVGCVCAQVAAERGAKVLLVEKEQRVATEASGRAGGSLRLQGRHIAEYPLAKEAMARWRRAGEARDFDLEFGGNVYFCTRPEELAVLERLTKEAHATGLTEVCLLSPEETRARLPAAEGPFLAAMWSPVDGQCNPTKATEHFARRAKEAGAELRFGAKATDVLSENGRVSHVVVDGRAIRTRTAALATGVWTPHLAQRAGVDVPVMPVVLSECETAPVEPLFDATLRAFGFGCRQRPDGSVVFSEGINATVRHRLSLYSARHLRLWLPRLIALRSSARLGLDARKIAGQIRRRSAIGMDDVPTGHEPAVDQPVLDRAYAFMGRVVPALAEAGMARTWGGIVDMSPDGLPIIDAVGPRGLALSTGASGHGLTLAPVVGEILADLALEGRTPYPIRPFRLARFKEEKTPVPTKTI